MMTFLKISFDWVQTKFWSWEVFFMPFQMLLYRVFLQKIQISTAFYLIEDEQCAMNSLWQSVSEADDLLLNRASLSKWKKRCKWDGHQFESNLDKNKTHWISSLVATLKLQLIVWGSIFPEVKWQVWCVLIHSIYIVKILSICRKFMTSKNKLSSCEVLICLLLNFV